MKAEPARTLYLERAKRLVEKNQVQRAFNDFDSAIRLDPTEATTYLEAAQSLWQQKERERSLAILNQGINAATDPYKLYTERGYNRSQLGDKIGTHADFAEALRRKPSDEQSYREYGWALFNLGEKAQALVQWKKANELVGVPNDDLLAGLSIGYWVTGQRDEALKSYRDLIRKNNDYKSEESIRKLQWPEKETTALLEVLKAADEK